MRIKSIWIGILLVASLGIIPLLTSAQRSNKEGIKFIQSKVFDVPDAPYKLKASSNGRDYEFCNNTPVGVIRFRLGCVKRKKADLIVIEQRPFEDVVLPASGETVHCYIRGSNHGFFPGEECKKGKLAVTEVVLENGDVWKLKP